MITQIRLVNFKAFADQTIDLAPMTLLTGLNGMGKSSVLQALLLLRQSYLGVRTIDDHKNRRLVLNGDLVQLGTNLDILFESAKHDEIALDLTFLDTDGDEQTVTWRFGYDRQTDKLKPTNDPEIDRARLVYYLQSNLFSAGFHYLQAERVGPRAAFEMNFAVSQQRYMGTRGEYALHFLEQFANDSIAVSELAHPQSDGDTLKAQVQAWLGEISPGTRLVLKPHPSMDLMQLSVSFARGRAVSSDYRATNVGFGITYILPVLIAILASKSGDLLLLENPEAHLHPKGQYKMGELMAVAAQAGIQLLVETHSDHVLNGVRVMAKQGHIQPQNVAIHFFQQPITDSAEVQPVEVVSPRLDKDGRIDQWPQNFFDEWENALDQLL